MEIKQRFSRDVLYKIVLTKINGCSEFCLVNANNEKDIYAIFEEEAIMD
jgi:hypothetical protein